MIVRRVTPPAVVRYRPAFLMLVVRRLLALVLAAALAACASARPLAPLTADASPEQRRAYNARVFDAVWALVDTRYYDPRDHGVDWARMRHELRPRALEAQSVNQLYGVLTVMLDRLGDAHAYVQSPREVAREAQAEAPRALFGVRLQRRGEAFVVDDVRPGGPADRAGVRIGWTLETSDDRPYDPAADRRAGVSEQLGFRDEDGRRVVLQVEPRVLQAGARRQVSRSGDVWVIRFDDFEPGTADWLFDAVRQVPPHAPIVVDLRDNVGGQIFEVERSLGCFLPRYALIARLRPRAGQERASIVRPGCPAPAAGPLAVLVGRRSRSGAEMFAAAVQERRRGVVVGTRTSGALLSSLRHDLPDGGRLTLSEADFLTAEGRRIDRVGLAPDLLTPTSQDDRRAGRDPALSAAAAALRARQTASEQVSAAPLETQ